MPLSQRSTRPGIALGLALVVLSQGCAFPPENVEVPLTGELEGTPRVDSMRAPDAAGSTASGPAELGAQASPAEASIAESAQPTSTAVEAPATADDGDPSAVDLHAIERDGEAELPPAVETELVLAEAGGTVDVAGEVSLADASAGVKATGGSASAAEEGAPGEPIPFDRRSIDTPDGLTMVYRVGGSGTPIVLIHGWCGNAAQWDGFTDTLARTHRVYAVDLLGHGSSSDQVRSAWTIPAYGADVARLIEEQNLDDVVLVGHAMGGQVALEAATRARGRVEAIVGVDSLQRLGVDPNPERLDPYIERFQREYGAAMEDFIDRAVGENASRDVRRRILDDALACAPEVAVSLMRHFGVHDPKYASRRIDCRVICINSDAAPTDVEGNRVLLTSFDVSIMKNVGHWPHLEAPQTFLSRLQTELARVGPRDEKGVQAALLSLSPVLYCENVAEVSEFYVSGLLFEEFDRRPRDESRAPDFVALRRDGVTVMIQSLATLRTDLPEVSARPRDGVLFLRVTNLDEELMRLPEGVVVAVPERRLSSGSRQIVVEDPAGTFVVLQQAPGVVAR